MQFTTPYKLDLLFMSWRGQKLAYWVLNYITGDMFSTHDLLAFISHKNGFQFWLIQRWWGQEMLRRRLTYTLQEKTNFFFWHKQSIFILSIKKEEKLLRKRINYRGKIKYSVDISYAGKVVRRRDNQRWM